MWEPFIQAVRQQVPPADVVHDKFHVSKYLNEAVDKVRRQEHKELMAQATKRSRAAASSGCITRKITARNRLGVRHLEGVEFETARAWAREELFTRFWPYQEAGWARRFFKDWFGWVSLSWLKPMIAVARMLKRHWENLLTYLKHRITNAVTEGLNSKIQASNPPPAASATSKICARAC